VDWTDLYCVDSTTLLIFTFAKLICSIAAFGQGVFLWDWSLSQKSTTKGLAEHLSPNLSLRSAKTIGLDYRLRPMISTFAFNLIRLAWYYGQKLVVYTSLDIHYLHYYLTQPNVCRPNDCTVAMLRSRPTKESKLVITLSKFILAVMESIQDIFSRQAFAKTRDKTLGGQAQVQELSFFGHINRSCYLLTQTIFCGVLP